MMVGSRQVACLWMSHDGGKQRPPKHAYQRRLFFSAGINGSMNAYLTQVLT